MDRQTSLTERFLRYVKIDTQSDEESGAQGKHPSTDKQRDLAALLADELQQLGLEVDYDEEHCYVYAFLLNAVGDWLAQMARALNFGGVFQ